MMLTPGEYRGVNGFRLRATIGGLSEPLIRGGILEAVIWFDGRLHVRGWIVRAPVLAAAIRTARWEMLQFSDRPPLTTLSPRRKLRGLRSTTSLDSGHTDAVPS
ncbi:MAG: hypothetical protein KJ072_21675 [Verrucomicrobia bacterium]|nr:hypothetical protein [Verrucomicrobiota bacterium]